MSAPAGYGLSASELRAIEIAFASIDDGVKADAIKKRPIWEGHVPDVRYMNEAAYVVLHQEMLDEGAQYEKPVLLITRLIGFGFLACCGFWLFRLLGGSIKWLDFLWIAVPAGAYALLELYIRGPLKEGMFQRHVRRLRQAGAKWAALQHAGDTIDGAAPSLGPIDHSNMFDVPPQRGN
jgi:hypothetical protein